MVFCLDHEGADLVVKRLRGSGAAAFAAPVDIGNKAAVENVIAVADPEFRPADRPCSNTGIATGMGVHAPAEIWEREWSPGDAHYVVPKNTAVTLAEWLAVTYKGVGVTCSALCPLSPGRA